MAYERRNNVVQWLIAPFYRGRCAANDGRIKMVLGLLLVYAVLIRPILVCGLMLPGPWGPSIKGSCPDGTSIEFRSRRVGREAEDILQAKTDGNAAQVYVINCTHATNI